MPGSVLGIVDAEMSQRDMVPALQDVTVSYQMLSQEAPLSQAPVCIPKGGVIPGTLPLAWGWASSKPPYWSPKHTSVI